MTMLDPCGKLISLYINRTLYLCIVQRSRCVIHGSFVLLVGLDISHSLRFPLLRTASIIHLRSGILQIEQFQLYSSLTLSYPLGVPPQPHQLALEGVWSPGVATKLAASSAAILS